MLSTARRVTLDIDSRRVIHSRSRKFRPWALNSRESLLFALTNRYRRILNNGVPRQRHYCNRHAINTGSYTHVRALTIQLRIVNSKSSKRRSLTIVWFSPKKKPTIYIFTFERTYTYNIRINQFSCFQWCVLYPCTASECN